MKYTKKDKILIESFVQAQKDVEHFYLQALREKNLQKAKYYAEKAKLIVQELQDEYQDWALTRGAEEYLKGFKQVEHLKRGTPKREQQLDTNKIFLQVGKVHKEAVLALLQSSNRAVFATLDGMKRDITYGLALFNQKGKEIGLQHEIQSKLGAGLLTGKSLHYQKSDLVAFFQKKGLQLRDRSGRKRNPHTYAEMLIRTETARAYNAGMINRALELGTSKFRIEESWNCCEICAQYNGKIVDISKGSYELPPFHCNCRGTVVPVWEEVGSQKEIFEERTNMLAEKHGIEGGNMLSKLKRLNKTIIKGKGYQTEEEKEIYRLKEDYLFYKIQEKGVPISNQGKNTTYKIKQGKEQVNRHISGKLYKRLQQAGLTK